MRSQRPKTVIPSAARDLHFSPFTGVSLLDGLLRFHVARGLVPRRQWRVDASVKAVF